MLCRCALPKKAHPSRPRAAPGPRPSGTTARWPAMRSGLPGGARPSVGGRAGLARSAAHATLAHAASGLARAPGAKHGGQLGRHASLPAPFAPSRMQRTLGDIMARQKAAREPKQDRMLAQSRPARATVDCRLPSGLHRSQSCMGRRRHCWALGLVHTCPCGDTAEEGSRSGEGAVAWPLPRDAARSQATGRVRQASV